MLIGRNNDIAQYLKREKMLPRKGFTPGHFWIQQVRINAVAHSSSYCWRAQPLDGVGAHGCSRSSGGNHLQNLSAHRVDRRRPGIVVHEGPLPMRSMMLSAARHARAMMVNVGF